ncbi:signal peptidase I [Arthrobacter sp. NPDC056691]|uniref:signal peptidase I n=1 Tax=Arthrobacter sp. NPDC056691 TaxID=3345913 RepID=UPI0036705572
MTAAATPAAKAPGPVVPDKGRLLLKAGRLLVRTAGSVLLAVAVTAFLFVAVGPSFLGYQSSIALTGSMAPTINPGDVVVTVPSPVSSLKTGEIITYRIPVQDRRVETHRIVELTRNSDGSTTVRTKGDANDDADPWLATFEGDTVDVHAATVPYLGTAIQALREPAVLMALTYGAPAVVVFVMLARIWRKGPDAADGSRNGADGAKTPAAG